jgi:hypothetical protein
MEMDQWIAAAEGLDDLAARVWVGERASGLAYFSDPAKFVIEQGAAGNVGEQAAVHVSVVAWRLSGYASRDRAYYATTMETNIHAVSQPHPQRFALTLALQPMLEHVPNRFFVFSQMSLSSLAKVHLRDADHASRLRVARTAVAIERYRLAHTNALPESLESLVPEFLPEIPIDPCDGAPLRFIKRERGYVVYGVGSDRADHGGLERQWGGTTSGTKVYDVTFTVER